MPKHLMPATPANAAGYWEPQRLVDLHDRMLAEAGSGWDDCRSLDDACLDRERWNHYRTTIAGIIAEEYDGAQLFAIKDPRICRLVPLYEEALDKLHVTPLYILPFRNPASVSKSLHARDGMTPCFAGMLWLRHLLDAEASTRGKRRAIVSFERLLSNWRSVIDDITANLEVSWPRSPQIAAADVEAFLDPALGHHSPEGRPLARCASIETWVDTAYRTMQGIETDGESAAAADTLDEVRKGFNAATSTLVDALSVEMQARQARYQEHQSGPDRRTAGSSGDPGVPGARMRLDRWRPGARSLRSALAAIRSPMRGPIAGAIRTFRRIAGRTGRHSDASQADHRPANGAMMDQNTIRVGATGDARPSSSYGDDFLSELKRVITTHADEAPRRLLEWGMGNSTKFFIENRAVLGLGALYSFDHTPDYFAGLLETLPEWEGFHPFCVDLMGPKAGDRDPEPNFSTYPGTLNMQFDIVFIDGRRRMECALASAQLCHSRSIVLLHDYRRMRYQGVRLLFDIVEDGTQFRVMKLKPTLLALRDAE